jgi:hypothetical protein
MDVIAPELRRLRADWNARRSGRFPKRSDFDPRDLRYILGRISLIDIHREPLRFFYRIHGSDLARRLGRDLTGKFFEPTSAEAQPNFTGDQLVAVAESGEPSVARYTGERVGDHIWNFEALVLPLSRDGHALDMLLSGIVHRETERTRAQVEVKNLQFLSEDDERALARARFAPSR